MDKELEETIKYLKAMRVIDFDKLGFVYAKETIDEVLNLIKQQQSELERKEYLYHKALSELVIADKVIDEMIEEYEFVHRANIINFCEDKLRKNACIQDCKLCIKQYFEKKVREE